MKHRGKKRRSQPATDSLVRRLQAAKVQDSDAIDRFRGGDPSSLIAWVKQNTPEGKGREFLIDVISGKQKSPSATAVKNWKRQRRNDLMLLRARLAEAAGFSKKEIVGDLVEDTGLGLTQVFEAIKKSKAPKKMRRTPVE